MRDIVVRNQWDPKWKDVPLGASGLTVGGFGCYTTFAAMGLSSFFMKFAQGGQELTPGALAKMLNAIAGYDADGQLQWTSLTQLFPDVKLYGRAYTTNAPNSKNIAGCLTPTKAIADIRTAVAKGQIVGILVDRVAGGATPDHIVLALETPGDLDDWMIADPDGGLILRFKDRYGSPLTGVYGYRTIVGTSANFPSYASEAERQAGTAVGFAVDARYGKKDMLDVLMSA